MERFHLFNFQTRYEVELTVGMTNEVNCWCYEFDHVNLSENSFWSVNQTLVTWLNWSSHLQSLFSRACSSFHSIPYMKVEFQRRGEVYIPHSATHAFKRALCTKGVMPHSVTHTLQYLSHFRVVKKGSRGGAAFEWGFSSETVL